jgi:hypothetical protein
MKQLKGFDFENLARAAEFFEEKGYTFVDLQQSFEKINEDIEDDGFYYLIRTANEKDQGIRISFNLLRVGDDLSDEDMMNDAVEFLSSYMKVFKEKDMLVDSAGNIVSIVNNNCFRLFEEPAFSKITSKLITQIN